MSERAHKRLRTTPGMVETPAVLSTLPLDNLLCEVHRLLGPTWCLAPYNTLLPSYLKPPSSKIQAEDLNFLIRKGALDIPPAALREEILKAYIRHVHPHMPFLDLNVFSDAIFNSHVGSNGQDGISLLLFQAVMFAGAFFVDLKHLYAAGFLSRRNALEILFERARVRDIINIGKKVFGRAWTNTLQTLHDFDSEDDELAIVQSLLLMTYWYENPQRNKDGRHWISVCISLACKISLHLESSKLLVGDSSQKFHSLLWWSIFTRDRMIAFGLQQPPLIKNEVYLPMDVPTAESLGIFNLQSFRGYAGGCYKANRESLGCIFIEKIKLCRCIRDDMFSWDAQKKRPVGSPSHAESRKESLLASKEGLQTWREELPSKIKFQPKHFLPPNDGELIFHIHCAWLWMAYNDIHSTVHRQLEFLSEDSDSPRQLSLSTSESPVLSGAVEMTEVAHDLCQKHLIHYLPCSSVPMILRAGIIHIQRMCTGDAEIERSGLKGLLQCLSALKQLSRVYGSALFLVSILGGEQTEALNSSTPKDILKKFDIETLDRLTLGFAESSSPTILKIREPYDVDVIAQLKSRRTDLCY
ncbi:uncharacterized protein N7483_011362 [Penicillium malachiteum]|uniref:uncharacterized protein n=1 Tax=Penicillium malachiteum TaxID=1324776 RepID=UPI0025472850|nr:uncharacterized protein N7483_011362 [Penicillium malachiteum]KAJ5714181.1 hypothetical protein N7483_011362 [Penicillium malachiteum]